MSTKKWDDLYDRLTSRKFVLALLSVVFAYWNYHLGDLTAVQFQGAVIAAVTVYSASNVIDTAMAPKSDVIAKQVADELEKRMKADGV